MAVGEVVGAEELCDPEVDGARGSWKGQLKDEELLLLSPLIVQGG